MGLVVGSDSSMHSSKGSVPLTLHLKSGTRTFELRLFLTKCGSGARQMG